MSLYPCCSSLAGKVRLWDICGSGKSVDQWQPFNDGLSAFDMHAQASVFARCVLDCFFAHAVPYMEGSDVI